MLISRALVASEVLGYTWPLDELPMDSAERRHTERLRTRADWPVQGSSPGQESNRDPTDASTENETARDRLRVAFDLMDVAERMLRLRLRRESPQLSDEALEDGIAEWYGQRRGAELGDAEGVLALWPRRRTQ
jgi:hypothetical protein